MIGAAEKRLREEFAKLQVEINDEKSSIVDLGRGDSFGFLGFEFRYSGIPWTSEKSFDRISGIDSSCLVKTNRNFLSAADRADLVKIVRDGLEEHRIVRRANAILLLDKGWSYAEVAEPLDGIMRCLLGAISKRSRLEVRLEDGL